MKTRSPRHGLVFLGLIGVSFLFTPAARGQTTCVPTLSNEAVTVRPGDTLGQLVVDRFFKGLEDPRVREELKLWGDSGMVARVASANQIRDPNRIRPGEQIRILDPASCNSPAAPAPTPAPTATPTPTPDGGSGTTPPPVAQPRQPSGTRLLAAFIGAMAGPTASYLTRGWVRQLMARSPAMGVVAAVAIPVTMTLAGVWAGVKVHDSFLAKSDPPPRAPDPNADVPGGTAVTRRDAPVDRGLEPISVDEELALTGP